MNLIVFNYNNIHVLFWYGINIGINRGMLPILAINMGLKKGSKIYINNGYNLNWIYQTQIYK